MEVAAAVFAGTLHLRLRVEGLYDRPIGSRAVKHGSYRSKVVLTECHECYYMIVPEWSASYYVQEEWAQTRARKCMTYLVSGPARCTCGGL